MVKVQIKSEKLTSFGGIFPIMEKFDRMLSCTIDSTLGLRSKVYGCQYSEIIRSLMCVYFCGGSCVEDVTSHLMEALCLHPPLRTCSADTILRAIRELTTPNLTYRSDSGKATTSTWLPTLTICLSMHCWQLDSCCQTMNMTLILTTSSLRRRNLTQNNLQEVYRLQSRNSNGRRCHRRDREPRRQYQCPFPSGRHSKTYF